MSDVIWFLIEAFTILLTVVTLVMPFFFSVRFVSFYKSFTFSILFAAVITVFYAWWRDVSFDLELIALGVDLQGLTTEDRMRNVDPELWDYAEARVFAPERLGVGWPIKAGFSLFLTLPYAGIVCVVVWVLKQVLSKVVERARNGNHQ